MTCTELTEVYTDTRFNDPHTIIVEASLDAIVRFDLDTPEGEHFDYVQDVISVSFDADDIKLVTCRTIRRPLRCELVLVRRHVAHLFARKQGEDE